MSTKGKEYKLAIRIAGIIDKSFTTSLATANSAIKMNVAAIDKNFTKLDKGFNQIMKVGKKCFTAISTAAGVASIAIGVATAGAIVAGKDFESAFAGVKKTVDATEAEYEKLKQDILDMSKVIPSSASDIAKVMEIAGQLGIANESLTDFTETMINLGVSTNMAAEEASTYLARFANIMDMAGYGEDGVSNFERLGSTVVDLGNNFATTEQEIVEIATSLAAAGKLANMSEADIMGMSAAMSSVGLTADSGASSMSRLIMQMQQAVSEGGNGLAGYAEVVGMTSEQFAELFRTDSAGAVVEFIEGLNRAGEGSYGILEDLDLNTIRLRKSFLSLAGADDLMSNAITMANDAWEENTALAIEAGKRYETVDSQIQIMKNAFSELGIVAYEELREPFVDVIKTVTDKVRDFTDYVGGPSGISSWMKNIEKQFPALKRKFSKYAEPVFDVLTSTVKWIAKHGNSIVSILVGLGTALTTYKIASNLVHIVNAIMSLVSMNPVTLGILGVVSAIGLLAGAVAAVKQHEEELMNSSLAEHFGDIALSMEDIQAIAEYILSSDSLGGVKEALKAFEELDVMSATIENAVEDINKLNWKVSIGMELTADEQESYKAAIAEYVSAAQDYVLQSQYAVSLNLSVGLGDSQEGADILSKVEAFYQASYDEMTTLGKELSEAVNEAFADNVLDPEEIDNIANLQAKMAEVQKSLATGEFEAELSVLGMKYSADGSGLTSESFMNLQTELNNQVAETSKLYEEAYKKNYAALSAALNGPELKDAIELLKSEYLNSISELNMKSATFQIETIMDAYSKELDENIATIQETIGTHIEEMMTEDGWKQYTLPESWANGLYSTVLGAFSATDISDGDKLALKELYDTLQPQLEQLKEVVAEYEALGESVPDDIAEDIEKSINNIYAIGAVSGDVSAMYSLIGEELSTSEEYATVIALAQEAGSCIPQEVIDAMTSEENMQDIRDNVDYILQSVKTGLEEGVQITIPVSYDLAVSGIKARKSGISSSDININSFGSLSELNKYINSRATGGLATEPELTWFAEKSPEMAIPIDGSRNAISLWEKTGELLGVKSVAESKEKYPATAYSSEVNKNLYQYKSLAFNSVRSIPINQRAEGGLATKPELTWFAEKSPEMAIPIDGSRNAISLWEKTGRLLGMDSVLDGLDLEGGNSSTTIEYSPTLQFYGEAPSKDDIESALRVSQDEFDSLMERYLKTHGRVSFG